MSSFLFLSMVFAGLSGSPSFSPRRTVDPLHDDFHAPVAGAAGGGGVARQRTLFGVAGGGQPVGATPCSIRKRTTVLARAVESSQLLGYSAPWMGTLSVLPSTSIGWVSSTFSSARSRPAAPWRDLPGGAARGEQQIVGEHPDDQAARFDRGLDARAEAVALAA